MSEKHVPGCPAGEHASLPCQCHALIDATEVVANDPKDQPTARLLTLMLRRELRREIGRPLN